MKKDIWIDLNQETHDAIRAWIVTHCKGTTLDELGHIVAGLRMGRAVVVHDNFQTVSVTDHPLKKSVFKA